MGKSHACCRNTSGQRCGTGMNRTLSARGKNPACTNTPRSLIHFFRFRLDLRFMIISSAERGWARLESNQLVDDAAFTAQLAFRGRTPDPETKKAAEVSLGGFHVEIVVKCRPNASDSPDRRWRSSRWACHTKAHTTVLLRYRDARRVGAFAGMSWERVSSTAAHVTGQAGHAK
jgi:hypothetical protein